MEDYTITYKSGHTQKIRASDLEVTYSRKQGDMRVLEMKWGEMRPKGMFINLDAIESVWKA